MELIIIAAVASNMVIGKDNDIPWHLPSDLKQFKAKTLGHPMILGRKTWESFGSRPLPKRPHVVISSQEMTFEHPNVAHAFDLPSAVLKARALAPDRDIYIIGGQTIYEQSMGIADRLFLSHVEKEIDGDRFFPAVDPNLWKNLSEHHITDDVIPYRITEYAKVRYPDA